MPEYSYNLGQGDAGIAIEAQLLNEDGLGVDLTGATVRFKMMDAQGAERIDSPAQLEVADQGRVSYTMTGPNLTTAGLFYAQWEVTFSGGAVQTFPNDRYQTVRILEEVA